MNTCPNPVGCELMKRTLLRLERLEGRVGIKPTGPEDHVQLLVDCQFVLQGLLETGALEGIPANDLFTVKELMTRLNKVGFDG